ncbi:MAG: O-methyltransferase [Candidatus Sericytochromatia bacterium]|nr:O-methyltransferase [Candidatus Sericytochromatia bacterium]
MLDSKMASPEVLEYILNLLPVSSKTFSDIELQAVKEHRPVISKDSGVFLSLLVKLMNAKYILEIGCNIGYSASWFLSSLPSNGHLDTLELNQDIADEAQKHFDNSDMTDKVTIHVGSALETIPNLNKEYDILFIDAAKKQYTNYLDISLPKLRRGGLILVDNVLWSGKVANQKVDKSDKITISLQAFNQYFMNHQGIQATILTIGDGIGFGIKR